MFEGDAYGPPPSPLTPAHPQVWVHRDGAWRPGIIAFWYLLGGRWVAWLSYDHDGRTRWIANAEDPRLRMRIAGQRPPDQRRPRITWAEARRSPGRRTVPAGAARLFPAVPAAAWPPRSPSWTAWCGP